jgi:hypothetical protein
VQDEIRIVIYPDGIDEESTCIALGLLPAELEQLTLIGALRTDDEGSYSKARVDVQTVVEGGVPATPSVAPRSAAPSAATNDGTDPKAPVLSPADEDFNERLHARTGRSGECLAAVCPGARRG